MVTREFAEKISSMVHQQGGFDYIAVKTASVGVAVQSEAAAAEIAHNIVGVLKKEAGDNSPYAFADFIEKIARAKGYPYLAMEDKAKLASAMIVDTALTYALSEIPDGPEHVKLATTRLYGREYMLEVLRGVI
jgi:hypothetical protein